MATQSGGSPQSVAFRDIAKLPDKNIDPALIKFANVTISSENVICVREEAQKSIAIVDLKSKASPTRLPIPADNAIMNPVSKVIALRVGNNLTMYSVEMKAKMKQSTISGNVVFMKWIDPKTVAIVTSDSVFHWSLEGSSDPIKMFDRSPYDAPVQIINYNASSDGKWLMLNGLSVDEQKNFNGVLQVYSVDIKQSQPTLNASAACFAHVLLDNRDQPSNLFCFARKDPSTQEYTLNMLEVGVPRDQAFSKQAPMRFADRDFPMNMIADAKLGILFVLSQSGYLYVYEIQSGKPIFAQKASSVTMFAACQHSEEGIVAVDSKGRVAHFYLDKKNCVPYICNTLNDLELGVNMARRYNLEGADHIFKAQFNKLMSEQKYEEAINLAASSPQGVLRNQETINLLKNTNGQILLQYFQILLSKGTLNKVESIELVRPVLSKGASALDHVKNWIKENKLEFSEELGDLLRPHNLQMALSIYLRAECKEKVVLCFLQLGANESDESQALEHFNNIIKYSKRVEYNVDYSMLIHNLVKMNGDRAKDFALMLVNNEDGPKLDINQITDLFLRNGDVKNSTNILLEYLRPRGDRPEDGHLQTKLLESNLLNTPVVANAIMDSEDYKFTHYDRIKIAHLCERVQLYQRALEHYTDPSDIKRLLTYNQAIKPEFLLEYFGTLSPELALECLYGLLKANLQQNIRLVVEIAKKWIEHIGSDKLIQLFEDFKSYNGLYFFLGSFVNFTTSSSVVFKYIEAATKIGPNAAKEVERVCRENNHYDAKEVKEFLMEQPSTVKDPRALIHVCDRFNFIDELINYLVNNNLIDFIKAFVSRKSPHHAPAVIGTLLDLNIPEDQIKNILEGVRQPQDDADFVERLFDSVERRNRLRLLRPWIEARSQESPPDPNIFTALAKIYIDGNNNPKHFLESNNYYDPLNVGKFCENRDPTLAVIVYKKGKCDNELVDVTNKNGFFKDQARYLVERQNLDIWESVLNESNPHRRSVIDQVVSTALPESHNADEVSTTVKAFMAADLNNELIELLERLMLHTGDSHFRDNRNLQNLLILTAVKADKSRVMEYIKRLDNFDEDKIAGVCLLDQNALYEEAFFLYKKTKQGPEAVNVLLNNIKDINRAVDFAVGWDHPEVWSLLANAQLAEGNVSDAIKSYIKADDATAFKDVILQVNNANQVELYNELILYLKMARTKVKDVIIDNEIVYSFSKTERLSDLEDFITGTNSAKLVECGDRVFNEQMYSAAKIIYNHINNFAKLAMTLVKLELWQEAVDAAKKAKAMPTWLFVCFSCVDAQKFKLAQVCAINVICIMEHLLEVVAHYEKHGYFNELIQLLEAGINLERTHQGIFTQLGICYAKYKEEKVMEHIKLFHGRSNIAQLIAACRQNLLWAEAVFLSQQYEQYENAIEMMIEHSAAAWKHELFKEILGKCTNSEIFYRSIDFYLLEHPLLLNDLLSELEKKLDHNRVVLRIRNTGNLPLIQSYLLHVQHNDLQLVNEAINELCIAEEDHKALRESIEEHKQFDQIALAQKLENHELLEFRRISIYLFKTNERYEKAIDLSKKDELWQDAMETCADSKKSDLAESLLRFFVSKKLDQCFSAMLFTCFDLITPDVVLELAWRHNLTNFVYPYMIQTFHNYHNRLAVVERRLDDQVKEKKEEKKQREEESNGAQDSLGLMGGAANMPLMITMAPPVAGMPMGGMPMNGMPDMGMPMGGMPMGGMPMGGMPMGGMPMGGMPNQW